MLTCYRLVRDRVAVHLLISSRNTANVALVSVCVSFTNKLGPRYSKIRVVEKM